MSEAAVAILTTPLTFQHWEAFTDLFGRNGACMGCWCTYWRLPYKAYNEGRGEAAREMMRSRIEAGPPPGVLALRGDMAVGWLQAGPRADTPQWNTPKRLSAPLQAEDADDPAVWGATCFFVRPGWRRRGVSTALLAAAIDMARAAGARVLEACPLETEVRRDVATMYVGSVGVFRRAGFEEIARRKADRPLMRLTL